MSLDFKQVVDGHTYNRWVSNPAKPNDGYTIAEYGFKTIEHCKKWKEEVHFEAYYLSMHFDGVKDMKTFKEAEKACLAHQKRRAEK